MRDEPRPPSSPGGGRLSWRGSELTPERILTPQAFDNAITLLTAIGGSTNAVIHLLALAGRLGVELDLARFEEISRRTPMLANLRPSGAHLFEDLFRVGGVPALFAELRPLLNEDSTLISGESMGASLDRVHEEADGDVIAPLSSPRHPEGGSRSSTATSLQGEP